jgi:hypothetical protein
MFALYVSLLIYKCALTQLVLDVYKRDLTFFSLNSSLKGFRLYFVDLRGIKDVIRVFVQENLGPKVSCRISAQHSK